MDIKRIKHDRIKADNLYRYLNFDQIIGFEDEGRVISKEEQAALV
ncbi:MAG: hypothetical protein WBA52_11100 [Dolichospermum sp.]|jgi:aconitate hydratase 2/2-methylisocitrate dehydratase